MQPIAQIIITLNPDGQVHSQMHGPNVLLFYGMLEQAKISIAEKQKEAVKSPGIEVAGPGFTNRLNGR